MDTVTNRFNKITNISILTYILDIIVGIFLITSAQMATKIGIVLLGSLILVKGLYSIIKYLYDGLGTRIFASELIIGVIGIILGVFTIFNPFDILTSMGILTGIWIIINGLNKLYYSIVFMKSNEEIYPLITFISILYIVMGVTIIINPFNSFILITKLAGYFIVTSALLDIISCLLLKKRFKNIFKLFK